MINLKLCILLIAIIAPYYAEDTTTETTTEPTTDTTTDTSTEDV